MAARNVRVVLVRPSEDKNIGSVCRAMKTMGFQDLRIVGKASIDRRAAAVTAVHAIDVLDQAVHSSTLREAVIDAALVAGITRRRGRWRKYFALTPESLARRIVRIEAGSCALVFGNEASGLSAADLSHCHLAVRIPSSPAFPSLNLSHAVQVITYQLFRQSAGRGSQDGFQPISGAALEDLVELMVSSLATIGFFTQGDRQEMSVFLRDIFARAALEQREAQRLESIFRKISGLIRRGGIEA